MSNFHALTVQQTDLSRWPDGYHSCYTLAGLSSAQHYKYWRSGGDGDAFSALESAFGWAFTSQPPDDGSEQIDDTEDRVISIHPIYVIPWTAVERSHSWFSAKVGF